MTFDERMAEYGRHYELMKQGIATEAMAEWERRVAADWAFFHKKREEYEANRCTATYMAMQDAWRVISDMYTDGRMD